MLAFVLMLIVLLLSPVSASISSRDALKENDTREMVADQLVELMDLPPTDSALSARMNTLWSAASAFFTQSSQLFQDTFDRLESNSRLVRNVTELPLEFVSPVNLNQLPAGNESTFERVFHQWQAFGITLQAMSDSFVQQLFRSILSNQHIELNRLQPGCTLALLQSMEALKTNQLWAMRMLDSSSKFNIHGFLDGTIVDLGSYDQCLSIKHDIQFNRSQDTHHIAGQYCILKFSLPLPPKPHRLNMHTKLFSMENTSLEQTALDEMADFAHAMYEHKIRLAFCIPSTCSNKDVQRLFEQVWPAQLPPVQVSSCQTTHDAKADNSGRSNLLSHWVSLPVENYELLLFLLYATLVCLVVCGSALDVYIQHQRKAAQSAHAHLQQQFSLNCYPPMAASLWRPTAHRSLDDNSYRMSSNPLAGQMTSTRQTTSAGNLNVSVGAGFKYITAANFDCSLPNDASNKLRFDWPPLESSVKSSTTSNAVHNRPPSRHSLDASSRRRQFQCNASKQRSFVGLPQPPVEPVLMTIRLFAFIPLSVEGKFVQTLLAFSLPTNFKSLLEIQSDCRNASKNQVSGADPVGVSCTRQNSEQIACLHGFRVISMTWIILTHTYLLPIKSTLAYSRRFLNVSESAWFQVIINGWVLVDSFFFVSALLLTSNQMRLLFRTNGRINLIRLIIGRLFRLAPTAWFLLSVMFLLPVVAPRGPLWDDYIGEQLRHCQTSWWANLIFINNWLPYEQLCMLHTWYLSADLQLFLGSLLFLLPMYSRPLLGAALLVVTTISSAVATFVYTYRNQLAPTVVFSTPNEMDVLRQTQRVYTITLAHVGPYCVGMLTGLALHHWPKIKLSWFVRNTLTMASICTALFILLFTQHWNLGDEWTPMTAAIYASTHRIGWSMCLAWIVYACASGNCDWINTILSCNLFEPFAKLSFCIYLVHYPLLWLRLSYARTPLPFGHYTMFCEFIVNFWLSVIVALVPYLLVECPANKLYRVFCRRLFECTTIELKRRRKQNIRKVKLNSVQFSSIKDYN